MTENAIQSLQSRLGHLTCTRAVGRVSAVDGTLIWVDGLADHAAIGDRVAISRRDGVRSHGEILRLRDNSVAVFPDDGSQGIARGDRVTCFGSMPIYPCDQWLGRLIDPYGKPLNGAPLGEGPPRDTMAAPPSPAARRGLGAQIATGLNVFDALLPLARGQRVGLFAGSGVGKSRLLGRLADGVDADVVVLALIGERGREVLEFVNTILGSEGMARAVVIAATSDRPAIERRRCLPAALSVAEHFRDQGKQVLLLADSLTRFAEAHREVALAAGELPAYRGFPASTAQTIMQHCERAGSGSAGSGDITAIFSVLVAGSDMDEPVADIVRGVLDGHVVLSRSIAERGRFPAVDLLRSVSRSLPDVVTENRFALISAARRLLGTFERSETMVRSGLYRDGSDPELDQALAIWPELDAFIAGAANGGPDQAFSRLELILKRAESASRRGTKLAAS